MPDANEYNSAGYATFGFQVEDSGSTANGGVIVSAATYTMTVDVTPVSDAPTAANETVTTLEDTSRPFSAGGRSRRLPRSSH